MITNGYTSLVNLKNKMGRSSNDKDLLLENCIERASRMIDTYLSSFFYELSLTNELIDSNSMSDNGFFISGNDIHCIAPIVSITSLSLDGVALVENTDYYVYKKQGRIFSAGGWASDYKGISFTGKIGYSAVPKDIEEICLHFSEAISGLGTRTLTDNNGNLVDILKESLPKWAFEMLKMRRSTNV